jgi:hypothetical protein
MTRRTKRGSVGTVATKDGYIREIAELIVERKWSAESVPGFAEAKGLDPNTTKQYANMAKRLLRIFRPNEGF